MEDIEGMARTMYALECSINQNRMSDWFEQPESVREEWRKYAKGVLNYPSKEVRG